MLPNDKIKTRNMSNEFTFDYFFLKKDSVQLTSVDVIDSMP